MSNQDMQFVDPEWRPTEHRDTDQRAQEVPPPPQPINADPREQRQWQNVPPPPQEEYGGPGYAGQQPGMMSGRWYGPQPYRRYRRRSPWRWIIVLLIILALMGGGVGSVFGIHNRATETKSFSVNASAAAPARLVIHESTGEIHVHAVNGSNSVTIQATKDAGGFFGNPNDIQVQYNQSGGNTIDVSTNDGGNIFSSSSVNFDVTVPTNTDLQLQSNTGTIEVHDVTGTMDLESNTGTITALNDNLTGSSTMRTNTGTVNFSGSISPGNYQFTTNTGSVDVALPRDSSFHVIAKTDTGSVSTDFPGLSVQHHNVGADLQGDVGTSPSQATVMLTTNTGSVDLHQN